MSEKLIRYILPAEYYLIYLPTSCWYPTKSSNSCFSPDRILHSRIRTYILCIIVYRKHSSSKLVSIFALASMDVFLEYVFLEYVFFMSRLLFFLNPTSRFSGGFPIFFFFYKSPSQFILGVAYNRCLVKSFFFSSRSEMLVS